MPHGKISEISGKSGCNAAQSFSPFGSNSEQTVESGRVGSNSEAAEI